MKIRKHIVCGKYYLLIWIFYNVSCAAEYNCSQGCVGLEVSSESSTDAVELDSENESSSISIDEEAVEIFNKSNLELLRFATPCETPNHEPTYCVELSQCPVLSAVASKIKYANFVEASKCGPKNENKRNFKVCCGKYNSFRNVSKQIDNTVVQAKIEDNTVLPKKCGTQRHIMRGRIVGGTEAAVGEYPWLIRIIHKSNYGYKTYGCAGFLIHTKYVVTAAHCIESEFTEIRGPLYSVVLGEHNVETKMDCSPGGVFCSDPPQVSRINKIVVHQNYSNSSKDHHNDIALIHLKKAAKLSDYVQPICLLRDANEEVNKYYISGWGKTETREASPTKLRVDISPFDKEDCVEKFKMLGLEIGDTQICAGGAKQKDSCNGDSGGPLMMSPNGTHYFAAGLVSYGIGCGMEDWPGVYTSIPPYVDWIQTEILKISVSDRSPRKGRKKQKNKKKVTEKPLQTNAGNDI